VSQQWVGDFNDRAGSAAPRRNLSFFDFPHLLAGIGFASTFLPGVKINGLRVVKSFARLNQ
jgi:hypothetical protein